MKTDSQTFSKFDWKRAFDRVALDRKYNTCTLVVASRLADRASGLCYDRGEALIASDIGRSDRTVRRSIKQLKGDGWLNCKRRAREENDEISLAIPDNMMSYLKPSQTGQHDVLFANSKPDIKRGSNRTHMYVLTDKHINTSVSSLRSDTGELTLAAPAIDPSWDEANRMLDDELERQVDEEFKCQLTPRRLKLVRY